MARQKPTDPFAQEYIRLAKQANQRMVRLERLNSNEFTGIKQMSYKKAQASAFAHWSQKAGANRFSETKYPTNKNSLKAAINDLKAFISSPSSSVGGLTRTYQKMADTFNSKYNQGNPKLTWQEIAAFYESKDAKMISSKIQASKTIAISLGEIKKIVDNKQLSQVRSNIKNNQNYQIVSDPLVDNTIKKILTMNGVSPSKMFK